MRRLTRPLAFAAGAALTIGAVVGLTALPGQAQTTILQKQTGLEMGGFVILETGVQDRIGYLAPDLIKDGTDTSAPEYGLDSTDYQDIDWRQTIGVDGGCRLALSAIGTKAPLLSIDAVNSLGQTVSTLNAGYVGDSIGVRSTAKGKSSEGTGTPCGEANGLDQQIRVTGVGVAFTAVELDLEAKYNADVRLSFTNFDPAGSTIPSVSQDLAATSDNAPDAGAKDNVHVATGLGGARASSVTIGITTEFGGSASGALSLEGGSDGSLTKAPTGSFRAALGTGASIFQTDVATGLLPCNGEASDEFTGIGYTGLTTVARLDDISGGGCRPLLYSLDWKLGAGTDTVVTFAVEASAVAQYRWTITARPEPTATALARVSEIDYDFNDQNNNNVPLAWCLGTYQQPVLPSTGVVRAPSLNDPGQGFCILERTERLTDTLADQVQVTETLYGLGDPRYISN